MYNMDRDKQIFSLGFSCGLGLAYERMSGIYDEEIKKHVNAIDWEAEKMFEMYDKAKIAFPEIFDETLNNKL
jgi:hypothetical protein